MNIAVTNNDAMANRVDLFTVRLDASNSEVAACRQLLSADEIARAGRFIDRASTERWLVCRARLRQVLAAYCRTEANAIRFAKGLNGKPAIAGGSSDIPLHFNLSHSHHLAAIAVTRVGPVGIDIEYLKPIRDWAGVAARFFSPLEQAQLAAVAPGLRRQAFYTCWTRKEALIKNTGEGLSATLDEFDVSLQPGVPAAVLADRADRYNDAPWQMHSFEPQPGYVGAAIVRFAGALEWSDRSRALHG